MLLIWDVALAQTSLDFFLIDPSSSAMIFKWLPHNILQFLFTDMRAILECATECPHKAVCVKPCHAVLQSPSLDHAVVPGAPIPRALVWAYSWNASRLWGGRGTVASCVGVTDICVYNLCIYACPNLCLFKLFSPSKW